ncbi:MAG: NADH-quinone oxidoreductase subunit H [Pseudobutyrivibrio sp.]|nr:NADH-quinone oxidoreductase subunit H [Pseudobutyrivibrio sp.]
MNTARLISMIAFIVFAPFVGGLLDGIDRKLTARMQGRKGPSILQPFYDISKLNIKEFLSVNPSQMLMIMSYSFFVILTGAMFYGGFDILLCFFSLSTAAMFLIMASTSTHTPYTTIGSSRELMQMMAYEPMVLITAVGLYLAAGSFNVYDIVTGPVSVIKYLPGIFAGFVFILTIKFRKSPFDLSTSHHAHQEIVKGVTTEMVGIEYALTIVTEWYENVFLYGVVAIFIINSNPVSWIVAAIVIVLVFFLEILIDNTSARVKWQLMLKLAWGVTIVCGGVNLLILNVLH